MVYASYSALSEETVFLNFSTVQVSEEISLNCRFAARFDLFHILLDHCDH